MKVEALLIKIQGLVQGVGFRPFIYRLAHQHDLTGWVENRNDGVRIHAEGTSPCLETFLGDLSSSAPPASSIRSIHTSPVAVGNFTHFSIRKSRDASEEITDISPDIAVCDECLEDMKSQPHRINYPFINCTNCGPRFTIISDLPYDREKTTMRVFPMCDKCKSEYTDILDRRFHAQPVACNHCGPRYEMFQDSRIHHNFEHILETVSHDIMAGKVLAIKGLGGFHLACDAFNEDAVLSLRKRKIREGKPFAVMFRDIDSIREYLVAGKEEEEELLSWQRPILILENRSTARPLAPSVSNGFHTTGAMLPYMPFHHLLFSKLKTPAIVLTSGNLSDEPILIENDKAIAGLGSIADAFVTYNRDILNRTDDSVAMVAGKKLRLVRRSRGYVPSPVQTKLETEGIFASGAELVNCFCIGKGKQALLSQHIGDLKNLETLEFYEESFRRFRKMYRFEPEMFVIDMHPDYLSRKFCLEYDETYPAKYPRPFIEIQHHHAHAASCMAEHGLDEEVIGVILDGVGYGTDGNIWGFEFMTCDLAGFKRIFHPEYIPQPGGDLTTREPWRMAISYLNKVYGAEMNTLPLPFLSNIDKDNLGLILDAMNKGINSPLTCSAGRLFDAISVITGACFHSQFHAEAPMRLEQMILKGESSAYPFEIIDHINTDMLIRGVVEDMLKGQDPGIISAKFHNTIISIIVHACKKIREKTSLNKVVLSGGTFQNRYLVDNIEPSLKADGFEVFLNESVPANDGGIALGQLAIAAKRRSLAAM